MTLLLPLPPLARAPFKAPNLGLLDKLKSKVGLNKKKVNSYDDNSSSSNNDISNGSGNKHSSKTHSDNDKGNKHSTKMHSGKLHNSKESDINVNVEYIGQGVLAGRENNSEMELVVDSQKRSHPDSDSVDSGDGNSFAVPEVPPLALLKRSRLLLFPWALIGLLLSIMTATAVALLSAPLLLGLPLQAHMLCPLALVMFRSLLRALVDHEAPRRSNLPFSSWLCQLSN